MTEQHHPERGSSATAKYTPAGHREKLAGINTKWRDATSAIADLNSPLSSDMQNAVRSSVRDGVAVPFDETDPDVIAYRTRVEMDNHYRLLFHAEQKIAQDFLVKLVTPLVPEPPRDQWGSVGIVPILSRRVPFTEPELHAIQEANDAHQQIVQDGYTSSGPSREFLLTGHHFPNEGHLSERGVAVWKLFLTARAAEDVLIDYSGSGAEARGELKKQLLVVKDLPDQLIRHKS